jgi:magnesium chelatase subunit I
VSAHRKLAMSVTASSSMEAAASRMAKPVFPFVKIAGQADMKLGLILNIIDPALGGVLIMGDRGTGKSMAVSKVLSRWEEL